MQLPVLNETREVLPPLYARWMDELLGGPIPAETEATCDDCAMCADGPHQPAGSGFYFDPSVKCCTYIPELANFTVGLILSDDDPAGEAGRQSVRARFGSHVSVSPLGIGRSPAEAFHYDLTAQSGAFGRNPELRCPHYVDIEGGRCGIWRHRNSVCATWFCKHVRGRVGHRFWRTIQQLLAHAEFDLMHWCIAELDLGTSALRRLLPSHGTQTDETESWEAPRLDGALSETARAAVWGRWAGREEAFYRECGRAVGPLSWAKVREVCGPSLKSCERITLDAYARLRGDELPERLRTGSFEIVSMTPEYYRIRSYSALDPIEAPAAMVHVLPRFDGRPVNVVLEQIARETGVQLDDDLLRKLADFGILVAA